MRIEPKTLVVGAGLLLLALLGAWWWRASMELRWEQETRYSEAFTKQQYLAATLLLRQHGHTVRKDPSLDLVDLDKLPDGLLILGGGGGRGAIMNAARAKRLRAWVARGNTLVFTPRAQNRAELAAARKRKKANGDAAAAAAETASDETDAPETADPAEASEDASADASTDASTDASADDSAVVADDEEAGDEEAGDEEAGDEEAGDEEQDGAADTTPPQVRTERFDSETDLLSAAFGVRSDYNYHEELCRTLTGSKGAPDKQDQCPPGTVQASNLRMVQVPGADPTSFDATQDVIGLPGSPAPAWADNQGNGVRAYRDGKGMLVALDTSMFRNRNLRDHDQGALLLALAGLNPHKHVTIIESVDVVGWQRLLWQNFHAVIVGLALLGVLLFWAAVRRFGPALPATAPERRSLMEHINASGAWLWRARGGRQVLIDAARADLQAALQRRAPGLLRLHNQQQHKELAALTGLSEDDIASAMLDDPSAIDLHFTRQIRTLQILRTHHER